MTGASTTPRFSDQPALSRRKRAALLLALLLVYAVLVVLSLTHFQADGDLEPAAALQAYSVPLDPPPPASPAPTPQPAGAEGAAAEAARPKPVAAAPAKIPDQAMTAAPAASTGDATKSGATSAGAGTGGGTVGTGTGTGGEGAGSGSGASRAVKIAGDITAARDYPARTRDLRLGRSVIVVLTVGPDGRVVGCRIHQPSPDAEADAITCRLATKRFRFRPATDREGNPIASEFGWQQRWFAP